ncbi:MAG: glycosyltransferase WbuB [Bacteroidetes bacterium]|nr:MAG: glycosyltransferase WbuB [Bacteroidota bacterium]
MKILILTQYYPPEVGAPQNRLHELAIRLKAKGLEIEVLTALPNYPSMEIHKEYRNGKNREEVIDGIKVYRAGIFVSKSKGIIKRLLNYFSFVWTSYWRGRKLGKYDFLLVESPPLFLGYSALRLSKRLKAKLIFNVSDLWPESAEKMGVVTNRLLLGMAYKLEAKCYNRSYLVTGQTMGIVDNIKERFPDVNVHWLPNGVDPFFYDPSKVQPKDFRSRNGIGKDEVVFFYGGIIGHAQGLDLLIKASVNIDQSLPFRIVLQGAGPLKDELMSMANQLHANKVLFLPPVPKAEMPFVLKEVDVALVPLRKLELFQGAIPSKIFEALAMEKALLLGVDGEARRHFIDRGKAGLFFEPENCDDLTEKMTTLIKDRNTMIEMGANGRAYVVEHFNRDKIAEGLIQVLKDV